MKSTERELTERHMKRQPTGTVSVRELLAYQDRDRYMDLQEAAEYLCLSQRTLRGHLKSIPHYRYGRKIIFKRSTLDQWLEQFLVQNDDLEQALELAEEILK